jgi:bacterioferritin
MKAADPKLIEALNDILTAELTAINQYFLHAKLCKNWGFEKLHGYIRKESIDEMKHAELITDRILFLDGFPNLQRLNKLTVGETVPEQLTADLALEHIAVERLNKAIELARSAGDNGTRELLERILVSEEEHIDWIETQQQAIQRVGLENWLTQQLG